MKPEEAMDEIQLIKRMIEETKRRSTAAYGNYFVGWGILILLAIIVNYVLIYLERYNLIWVDWIVFMGLGTVISAIDGSKKAARAQVQTYTSKILSYVWAGCGVAFILVGFIFPILNLYSYRAISPLVSLVAGLGMFVTGGLYEWSLLKWAAAIWWLGAIALVFAHGFVQGGILILLVVVGYLYPGIQLNRHYGKKGGQDATENA